MTGTARLARFGGRMVVPLGVLLVVVGLVVGLSARAVWAIPTSTIDLVGPAVRYDASQGQTNDTIMSVATSGGMTTFRFSDVYPIRSTLAQCRMVPVPAPRHQMVCQFPVGNRSELVVRLWDRHDTAHIEEHVRAGDPIGVVRVDAGSGNDVLLLDHVSGPAGWPDMVDGGPGDDTITADRRDDVFRGGEGVDTVSYQSRQHAIHASLAAGEGGQRSLGERDRFEGVENLIAGGLGSVDYGQDLLVGDAANNRLVASQRAVLIGLAGDDVLVTGSRDDHLLGGPGRDRLYGGPGADVLDGGADTDTCYPNTDPGIEDCEIIIFGPARP